MKRILILLLGLFSVAYGQFSPTSAKTKFVNGLSIGSKDSTYFTNAGDTIVLYFGRDSAVYARFKGIHRRLAYAGGTDFVPYTGAVTNVNLGNYRLTARSIKTDSIYANSSAGMYLTTNTGTAVAHWGGGGSVEVDFKGFAGYDANRAGSYTARSFTDKNYVDSSTGLRVRYTDTATMLSPYARSVNVAGTYKAIADTFFNGGYTTRARTKQLSDSLASTKLNLSGGTLTGALNGTSLSMSGGGSFGGLISITNASATLSRFLSVTGSTTAGTFATVTNTGGALLMGVEGSVAGSLFSGSTAYSTVYGSNTATDIHFSPNNIVRATVSNDGTFLINTTTTDGANKLIVNGGVKGTRAILNNSTQSQMEAWGWSNIQGASSATGELRIGGIEALQGRIVYSSAGSTTMYIENTFDDANAEIKFRTRVAGTAVTPLTITSTSATFSSSVTAAGNISTTSTTASTNTSNGALVVAGGVGIGGALNIAGAAFIDNSIYAKGHRFGYGAKASNYTLTDTDDYINVTASCTITLPTAVGRAGKRYVIKCIGSVTATIASTSSETIDGNAASTYTFGGPNFNIMIVYSNGANWNLEAWQTGI